MPPVCFQMYLQVLSGLLLKIWVEFLRVRNPPSLNKKPGLQPMVLNRADLVWFLESFQTFWNVSYVRGNGFPTTFGVVPEDLGWIPKGAKSTDFHQKPWAIAHGFEHGRFREVLGIVPNSLKCLLLVFKCFCKYFRDCSWRFGVNSEGSEMHRFWAKSLGYSPWFWTWRIWVSVGNLSKLTDTSPVCSKMDFQLRFGLLVKIWCEFRGVRTRPISSKRAGP